MAHARLVALGALVGIPAAAAAAVFLGFVHELQHWLWTDVPDALGESGPPWYLVLGLPVAGAAIVWIARTVLPGDGGHTPLHGIDPPPLRSRTHPASSWPRPAPSASGWCSGRRRRWLRSGRLWASP